MSKNPVEQALEGGGDGRIFASGYLLGQKHGQAEGYRRAVDESYPELLEEGQTEVGREVSEAINQYLNPTLQREDPKGDFG